MQILLGTILAFVTIAAAAANLPSEDEACSLSDTEAGQREGHRSLIHRHSVRELSQERRSSSGVDVAAASHRKSLDQFILQLGGKKDLNDDVHSSMKQLQAFLDTLGYTEGSLEGHSNEFDKSLAIQTSTYDEWATTWNLNVICETGFNAGHSALRFLAQSWAQVYEFDLCDHAYAQPAGAYLYTQYPGRIHLMCGDSRKIVPEFHKNYPDLKCDLIIIDGGHDVAVAEADLQNLAMMASDNAAVAIDDTPCTSAFCGGPNTAWAKFVADGCVTNETKVPMGPTGVERGFSFGRLKSCDRLKNSTKPQQADSDKAAQDLAKTIR